VQRPLILMFLGLAALAPVSAAEFSDAEVRERIVNLSVAAYRGNCPCPYHVDRAGRSCGARSAWSRAGGATPICYADEISADQVRQFRDRNGLQGARS
jgi:hypothetical protein